MKTRNNYKVTRFYYGADGYRSQRTLRTGLTLKEAQGFFSGLYWALANGWDECIDMYDVEKENDA